MQQLAPETHVRPGTMLGTEQAIAKEIPDTACLDLSRAQHGIWLGQQLDPANTCYWTAEALLLRESAEAQLDTARLQQACINTLRQSACLQARFSLQDALEDGPADVKQANTAKIVQEIAFDAELAWQSCDFSHLDAAQSWQAAQAWMQQDLQTPANLQHGPLLAAALIKLNATDYLCYLRVHHIALDGYGYSLLWQELARAYQTMGQDAGPWQDAPMLPAKQASALAAWQAVINEDAAYQQSPARQKDQAFWLQAWQQCQRSAALQGEQLPNCLAPQQHLARQVRRLRGHLFAEQFSALQALASGDANTPAWPACLLAAVAIWHQQSSGRSHFVFGLPVMNRLGSCAAMLPCMAMNITPLMLKLDLAQSWLELAKDIERSLRTQRMHQRYRYEDLKLDLQASLPSETPAIAPTRLFGTVVNIMPFQNPAAFADLHAEFLPISSGPVEDLALSFAPCSATSGAGAALRFDLEANPNAYSQADLVAHHSNFLQVFAQLLAAPRAKLATVFGAQQPMHAPERAIIDGPALPFAAQDVLTLLRQQAALRPDQLALAQGKQSLSYGELLIQVQQMAAALNLALDPALSTAQAMNLDSPAKVIIALPRSPETIVAILAVLWLGAAYIPLDPAGPAQRIGHILAEHAPCLILTRRAHASVFVDLLAACPAHDDPAAISRPSSLLLLEDLHLHDAARKDGNIGCQIVCNIECQAVQAESLAYLMYTSGSTGKANGVMISRAALAHFVAASAQRYQISAEDRILQFAPLHFDASVEEIFLALCHGASLILREESMLASSAHFFSTCQQLAISVLDLPTAYWHELAYFLGQQSLPEAKNLIGPALRLVIIGGEAVQAEHLARWRAVAPPQIVLLNTYGPTETTVICSCAQLAGPGTVPDSEPNTAQNTAHNTALQASQAISIGTPLAGLRIVVCREVDGQLLPLAIGQEGELCVIGASLATAYWQRPELNARRFVQLTAMAGAPRAYRTGDRVVLGTDGQLRYFGRVDQQIKIAGLRIEPSEVEACLLRFPTVREAAVLAVEIIASSRPTGAQQLAAFICSDEAIVPSTANATITPALLQDFLQQYLAAAAIPSHFYQLPSLGRNANGKIDRHALLAHHQQAQLAAARSAASASEAISGSISGAISDSSARHGLSTQLEKMIAQVFSQVLGHHGLNAAADFLLLGGRSLQAIQIANRLSLRLRSEVAVADIYQHSQIGKLANVLAQQLNLQQLLQVNMQFENSQESPARNSASRAEVEAEADASYAPVLKIRHSTTAKATLFCLPPAEGLSWCYLGLSQYLEQINIIGLQSAGLQLTEAMLPDVEQQVQAYLQQILHLQATGPYYLLGWSSGGGIAQALAAQLQARGLEVGALVILDAYPSSSWQGQPMPDAAIAWAALLDVIGESSEIKRPIAETQALLRRAHSPFASLSTAQLQRLADCSLANMQGYRQLQHGIYTGPCIFVHASQASADAPQWQTWLNYLQGQVEHIWLDSTHAGLCQAAPLAQLGQYLQLRLHNILNAATALEFPKPAASSSTSPALGGKPVALKASPPRLLRIKRWHDISPFLRRIILSGSALQGFPEGSDGAHIKLMLARDGQAEPVLPTLGADGPIWPASHLRPITRTYTVAAYDPQAQELAVDFVLHGDNGPASRWASGAQVGAAIGVAGPAAPARFAPEADFFLMLGDPSAFAMLASSLAALPSTAQGMVLLEIASASEMIPLPHPPGMRLHWFVRQGAPASHSTLLLEAVRGMPWPEGQVSITLAGESRQTISLRDYFLQRGIAKAAMYAMPYWKESQTEEEYHQERHRLMDQIEEAEKAEKSAKPSEHAEAA